MRGTVNHDFFLCLIVMESDLAWGGIFSTRVAKSPKLPSYIDDGVIAVSIGRVNISVCIRIVFADVFLKKRMQINEVFCELPGAKSHGQKNIRRFIKRQRKTKYLYLKKTK